MEIEEAIAIGIKSNLTLSQVGYMLFIDTGEKYPLRVNELEKSDLHMRKFIVNGMPTELWKESKDIVKSLKPIKFGYTEEVMEVLHKVNMVLREDDMDSSTLEKILREFDSNEQLGVLFCIWLSMFPTSGKKNIGWDKLFGIPYTGVTLRIFTPKLSTFFKKVARRKDTDMSMFVLGTYLFVRSYIQGGKTFIPKIQRYMDTWEEWHSLAMEKAGGKTAVNIERLFYIDAGIHRTETEVRNETVKQVGFVMD